MRIRGDPRKDIPCYTCYFLQPPCYNVTVQHRWKPKQKPPSTSLWLEPKFAMKIRISVWTYNTNFDLLRMREAIDVVAIP